MKRIFLAVAACALPWTARGDVEPGNWELTVTTSVEGMPQPIGPITQPRCISAEDARDPSRVIGARAGCEFTNRRDTGSVFTFDVNCSGQIPLRGSGSVRYTSQTMEADLQLSGEAGGQKFATRSQVSGNRPDIPVIAGQRDR